MPLINLMVIYLQRKYGVPLHNFFEKWSSGISYLKGIHRIQQKLNNSRKYPLANMVFDGNSDYNLTFAPCVKGEKRSIRQM